MGYLVSNDFFLRRFFFFFEKNLGIFLYYFSVNFTNFAKIWEKKTHIYFYHIISFKKRNTNK
jgi:hypothetical protein